MEEKKWKRIRLRREDGISEERMQEERIQEERVQEERMPVSGYLIASSESEREAQKELLYSVLGPVFFGKRAAGSLEELAALFREKYGIDVLEDFCEGDEHYEEYHEARQAIAEGLSIYDGRIPFQESGVAELAERVWGEMEREEKEKFRRINTMLEE